MQTIVVMDHSPDFCKPAILDMARGIVKGRDICLNCLGRQFAHVSTGMTNLERGEILGGLLNYKTPKNCSVCDNLLTGLEKLAEKSSEEVRGIEFETFLVGSRLSNDLIRKEESLWEDTGVEYAEPLKSEINREVGKILRNILGKEADKDAPDLTILLDLEKGTVELDIRPLFISGKYKKLVRGIPQTKWDKYKITVEDIIAKPFMKYAKGAGHSMHASGREDIDARCLDWRPFVLQIDCPRKRKISISKINEELKNSKKVAVSGLKFVQRSAVAEVKAMNPDKTYRALVEFEKPVGAVKLEKLVGIIRQETPTRVLHRRADKLRKRRVKSIKARKITNKRFELIIKGEAGLYIKELVTGDAGRTKPSVAELMGNKANVTELDVIRIHLKK